MNDQRSILIVGSFLTGAGRTPNACEELARRVQDTGWLTLTTSSKLGRVARLLDMLNTAWGKRCEYRLAAVETFSGPAFFWAEAVAWVLRVLRKPYVLSLRGGNLPEFARGNSGRVLRLLWSAAAVTAPSRYLQEGMRSYRGDIRLLPNAIDVHAYPFQARTNPAPRMVWVRAFHEIYNPSMALALLVSVLRERPAAALTMVGPDKGDGSLQAFRSAAAKLGVEGRIEYAGLVRKADVPSWLGRGDVFINTTNVDNTPVSVIEAMACGLCVVSTNVGGIPYLLENEVDALLVPPNDAKAMSAAVGRILTEPGLAEKLSRNARRKAELFDWQVILPQWESLFTEVIGRA